MALRFGVYDLGVAGALGPQKDVIESLQKSDLRSEASPRAIMHPKP